MRKVELDLGGMGGRIGGIMISSSNKQNLLCFECLLCMKSYKKLIHLIFHHHPLVSIMLFLFFICRVCYESMFG